MAFKIIPDYIRDVLAYDPETGDLIWKVRPITKIRVGDKAGTLDNFGYLSVQYKGVQYRAHRVCWFLHHGEQPEIIDHINRKKSDNRIANLRSVDYSANNLNRRYSGISWEKSRAKNCFHGAWRAQFRARKLYCGKSILLAYFHRVMAERAHHPIGLPAPSNIYRTQ